MAVYAFDGVGRVLESAKRAVTRWIQRTSPAGARAALATMAAVETARHNKETSHPFEALLLPGLIEAGEQQLFT